MKAAGVLEAIALAVLFPEATVETVVLTALLVAFDARGVALEVVTVAAQEVIVRTLVE